MNIAKKISPQSIFALRDALSVIFWKKEDLREFLKLTLDNNPIIATLDWNNTKREIVKEVIERMTIRQDIYQEHLLNLLFFVANFDDFSNLKYWDEDGLKTKAARVAVNNLRNHTKGYMELSKENEDAKNRKSDFEKKIKQIKSLNEELALLRSKFNELVSEKNFQKRGYELEKLLYDVFLLYELEPKGAFKIYGEQIDGAFTFQGTDFLLEAKWSRQVDRGDLANFCHKVETKFKNTSGLLVTIEGLTPEALSADFKSIIIMDCIDLIAILDGRIRLPDLLFKKRRKASETGRIYVNYQELAN
ncbi:MAG: restriction endonuclease [Prevotellaceae bacterium]|jgi:hypothetical protein|nr:restriction endonuclease [Prevotellaceae bacterium]